MRNSGPKSSCLGNRALLRRADVQQLAGVVPLVDGVRDVEPLVALQPDQPRVEDASERLRGLGLADARLTLEQQRLLELQREEERRRQPAIGQVLGVARGRPRARRSRRSPPRANSTLCTIGFVSRELDVMIPTTPEEAVAAFGEGDGITVLAGGTIVMPELTHGRLKPGKVLMLGRSGLDKITREGGDGDDRRHGRR